MFPHFTVILPLQPENLRPAYQKLSSLKIIMLRRRWQYFLKKLLENKEKVFQNGVKSIQAAAYNGMRTVNLERLLSARLR